MYSGMVLHVVLGALLLLIPVGMLYLLDRKMLGSFLMATVRMVVQLLVLCLMVWLLIRYDRWWVNLLWAIAMTGYAAFVVVHKMKDVKSAMIVPVGIGLSVGSLFVGLYLLLFSLPSGSAFHSRWFVPVIMLLLGHSLTTTLRGMKTYLSALKSDEEQYEFKRGNGASHLNAVMPFVRRAFIAVMSPTISNLNVTALYTMPLLLCGFFIAGVKPINAFVVMVILVIGCVAASVLSLVTAMWLADRNLFDSFGKLR